jgi:hypothetical protein
VEAEELVNAHFAWKIAELDELRFLDPSTSGEWGEFPTVWLDIGEDDRDDRLSLPDSDQL